MGSPSLVGGTQRPRRAGLSGLGGRGPVRGSVAGGRGLASGVGGPNFVGSAERTWWAWPSCLGGRDGQRGRERWAGPSGRVGGEEVSWDKWAGCPPSVLHPRGQPTCVLSFRRGTPGDSETPQGVNSSGFCSAWARPASNAVRTPRAVSCAARNWSHRPQDHSLPTPSPAFCGPPEEGPTSPSCICFPRLTPSRAPLSLPPKI